MTMFYENFEQVAMHRTCGRGLHGLNHENRHRRKHVRRFLAWYVGRSESRPAPIRIVGNFTLVSGVYHDGWSSYKAEEVYGSIGENCKRFPSYDSKGRQYHIEKIGISFDGKTFIEYGDYYSSRNFQRDGIPNNYCEEAKLYDNYCLTKNTSAYRRKHEKVIDWTETYRDEILKEARDFYARKQAVREFSKLPDNEKRLFGWKYKYWRDTDFEYFCYLAVNDYHNRIKENVVTNCNYSQGSARQSLRQLRALGFVA